MRAFESDCPPLLQALAILCMMCAAPAFHSTQHWFLLVVALCFAGTGFFTLYYMCLDTYLKNSAVNWLQTVSSLHQSSEVLLIR